MASAPDGEQALILARRDQPHVIILDLMLPGVDGLEVCRQLRSFSDAYVIMLTARSEELDALIGLPAGVDDYLAKPFSPRELVARVHLMLRSSAAHEDAPVGSGGSGGPRSTEMRCSPGGA